MDSKINYYQRHIGDYMRDTGHLSMTEHGAYTLLLDKYYATKKPIPNNADLHKSLRAKSKEEKSAIDYVLNNFFTLKKNCWTNKRADQELKKMRDKIKLARINGKNGGRPKLKNEYKKNEGTLKPNSSNAYSETDIKPSRLSVGFENKPTGFENKTHEKANHKPITNNHKPIIQTKKPTKKEESELYNCTEEICVALTQQGFIPIATSRVKIIGLLKEGASIESFIAASKIAQKKNKGLPYLLGIVEHKQKNSSPKAAIFNGKNIANGVNDDGSF
jgi:uncharacterized protein YdaU (DUF1376 family)